MCLKDLRNIEKPAAEYGFVNNKTREEIDRFPLF